MKTHLIIFFLLVLFGNASAFSQGNKPVVRFQSGAEPIKAVSFNIGDKTFPFDKPFNGSENWLRELSVNLENSSGKTITYVEVAVSVRSQKGRDGFRYSIAEGNSRAALEQKDSGLFFTSSKISDVPAKLLNIRAVNQEQENFRDQASLDRMGLPLSIEAVDIQVLEVVFKDGTMWSSGGWYKLNPEGSGKLVRIDKDGKVVPLTVIVGSQEDSPLHIIVLGVDSSSGKYHLIDYSVQNVSQKNIKAYVVSQDTGMALTTLPGSFFVPGQFIQEHSREEDSNLHDGSTLVLSVDFVLFEDGSSWGKDTAGRSELIYGYFDGRKDAVTKARELLKRKDDDALFASLNSESSEKSPVGISGKGSDTWKGGYGMGYRGLFSRLKSEYETLGRDGVERRLKELEKPSPK